MHLAALLLEGSDLEDVSEAEGAVRLGDGDATVLTPSLLDRIVDRVRELAEAAGRAADELGALPRRTSLGLAAVTAALAQKAGDDVAVTDAVVVALAEAPLGTPRSHHHHVRPT